MPMELLGMTSTNVEKQPLDFPVRFSLAKQIFEWQIDATNIVIQYFRNGNFGTNILPQMQYENVKPS